MFFWQSGCTPWRADSSSRLRLPRRPNSRQGPRPVRSGSPAPVRPTGVEPVASWTVRSTYPLDEEGVNLGLPCATADQLNEVPAGTACTHRPDIPGPGFHRRQGRRDRDGASRSPVLMSEVDANGPPSKAVGGPFGWCPRQDSKLRHPLEEFSPGGAVTCGNTGCRVSGPGNTYLQFSRVHGVSRPHVC